MALDAENLQADQVSEWLREGIAAVKSGQHERARELLIRVVARDDQNVQAWLWLSGAVESLEDRKVCLENVLKIDPDNAAARKGLAWVQQQMQGQAPDSPVVQRARTPVSHAAALLREDFRASQSPLETPEASAAAVPMPPAEPQSPAPISPAAAVVGDLAEYGPLPESELKTEPEPALPPSAMRDEFANEYGCPHCATETEPDDRRCKSCGQDLWVKFRKQEKRSNLLWVLLALQVGNAIYLAIPAFLLLFLQSSPFFEGLLGVSEIPRIAIYLLALPGAFSVALAVGLYFRWKPVYYLLFVDAVIGVISAIAAFVYADFFSGGAGFALALGRLVLIFQLGGDFEWDRRRILLRTDRGLTSSVEYLTRADFYNEQKMWAMAVVHLRAALGLLPDRLDCHLALAVAYIRLKRYDLADRVLAQAKGIKPDEPRIAQLEALVDEMRSTSPALP